VHKLVSQNLRAETVILLSFANEPRVNIFSRSIYVYLTCCLSYSSHLCVTIGVDRWSCGCDRYPPPGDPAKACVVDRRPCQQASPQRQQQVPRQGLDRAGCVGQVERDLVGQEVGEQEDTCCPVGFRTIQGYGCQEAEIKDYCREARYSLNIYLSKLICTNSMLCL
jgi:hypothetical protein